MRVLALLPLILLPFAAHAAEEHCQFQAPRSLDADLRGVTGVTVEVHSHDLRVDASGTGPALALRGRACASAQDLADALTVTQRREGSQLIITLGENARINWTSGSHYAYLKVAVKMPANVPVVVHVGSGDAETHGVASLDAEVGSGDLNAYDTVGAVKAHVGSGDVTVKGAASVEIPSVGSGDAKLSKIAGAVRVGSIGSGDLDAEDIGGNVDIGTLGSGDVKVDGVKGSLTVQTKGSGEVEHRNVGGKVSVPDDH
jgi:hypothetical protein